MIGGSLYTKLISCDNDRQFYSSYAAILSRTSPTSPCLCIIQTNSDPEVEKASCLLKLLFKGVQNTHS